MRKNITFLLSFLLFNLSSLLANDEPALDPTTIIGFTKAFVEEHREELEARAELLGTSSGPWYAAVDALRNDTRYNKLPWALKGAELILKGKVIPISPDITPTEADRVIAEDLFLRLGITSPDENIFDDGLPETEEHFKELKRAYELGKNLAAQAEQDQATLEELEQHVKKLKAAYAQVPDLNDLDAPKYLAFIKPIQPAPIVQLTIVAPQKTEEPVTVKLTVPQPSSEIASISPLEIPLNVIQSKMEEKKQRGRSRGHPLNQQGDSSSGTSQPLASTAASGDSLHPIAATPPQQQLDTKSTFAKICNAASGVVTSARDYWDSLAPRPRRFIRVGATIGTFLTIWWLLYHLRII